jgi:hypothetical protein
VSFGIAPNRLIAVGYEQLPISTIVVALTVPAGARWALIALEGANGVRWRADGTPPTAAIGMPLAGGATLEFEGLPAAIRLIRSGAADALANVTYFA